ncbi:MAG TPA: amylo-alpha-1,6-glucosidase [Candidatus Binataceae bacterium]|nr:amylo-alpha-1,6-glucosidase [Candidatus Binataceae bacterium]
MPYDPREWLEADGLGGFVSGTASGIRTRRYHAILLAATAPPSGRMVLVNGFEAWIESDGQNVALTSQRYGNDVVAGDGANRIREFTIDPWPRWIYALPDGREIEHGVIVQPGRVATILCWRLLKGSEGTLAMRPLMSGRDYHSMHHENGGFNFTPDVHEGRIVFRPYHGVRGVAFQTTARYEHQPDWYRNFFYTEEQARGLDCFEDLASPGVFRWDLSKGEATLTIALEDEPSANVARIEKDETARRAKFSSRLARAADAYIVKRRDGKTIIAGYPWFTDWGRDTFISMRGLCIASGRLDDARSILLEWSGAVSEGMLPNRFPDYGEAPEYNAVDASLWYIVAVYEFLRAQPKVSDAERKQLLASINAILGGYSKGTRYNIRCDNDGLIAAGQPGVQLTWMDAKIGDWVVTPRIGKPVEIQALWLNALKIASALDDKWKSLFERGKASFVARFWNEARGFLNDVVDSDHAAGKIDASLRPNQIFAVGGLPFPILEGEQARRIVEVVEKSLVTPIGLRSLAPDEPGYKPHYGGDSWERDFAYHQGTVWPWLMGAFIEAWVRMRGETAAAKAEARKKFLAPMLAQLDGAGLGHLPEIADAEPPHTPRGCPFQAWSVAEALRVDKFLG